MRETCEIIRALLPYYADGEVSEGEAGMIREHVAGCAECRREAAEWAALGRIVSEGLRAEEPFGADELEAAVQRVHEARPLWRAAPTPVRFWRSWAPVAGLAALALVIAFAASDLLRFSFADAGVLLRDETAALVSVPGELATDVPRDYQALRRSARSWPQRTAEGLGAQWDRGMALSQAVTRRVGPVPLAACALLLLAANFALVREARSSHGRLQRG